MEPLVKTGEKEIRAEHGVEREPYIIFKIAGTTYAVHSSHVQQMEMVGNITPVPNTPPYVDGVMFSRGQVVPVINMRIKFGVEKIPYDIKTRVIVIRHEGRVIGLLVDSAKEYLNIPVSAVREAPELITGSNASWLKGIASLGERTILIFDVNELLRSEEKIKI